MFDLPLSSSYLGVYFGHSGSKIKQVNQQFGVKVHISPVGGVAPSRRGQRMYAEKLEARVEGGGVEKDLLAVKKELISRAQAVQENRKKHEENVVHM